MSKIEAVPALLAVLPGAPFNPARKVCGFWAPDAVARQLDLSDGPKRLYERLVRWAGQNAECWYGFEAMGEALGKSGRQVKRDVLVLEEYGLIRHDRRGNRLSNTYEFLWHPMFDGVRREASDGTSMVKVTGHPWLSDGTQVSHELSNELRNENYVRETTDEADYGQASKTEANPDALLNWTEHDVLNLSRSFGKFMDGEEPPEALMRWTIEFAQRYERTPADIQGALDGAWSRNARPGRKNRPDKWKWFYEVLRNALQPGYAGRLPEAQ
ncbi:MAG TPA: hypothetical protein VNY05_25585 [Candidatus Acidoferrales bacterium]|nr:hypothetical protein [Candidatus Acidoferrales bacterium]